MSSKKIAIIGAGNSGIGAFKACKEQGLEAIVYEKTDQICGQWLYREESIEGITSIYKSLTCNSSKEMTAFSDYPPPDHFPIYMSHSKMAEYISLYADRIGFIECVKLKHEVMKCEPNYDYGETGKWKITVKDLLNNHEQANVYDGVMICTGQTQRKEVAQFKQQEMFKGKIIHSHEYKEPKEFENKNVIVVGCGVSGADIAVDLSESCSQVFVSVRSGNWFTSRLFFGGLPFDHIGLRRWCYSLLPRSFFNYIIEYFLKSRINHVFYGLKPSHKFFDQLIFFTEFLPLKLMLGQIIIKPEIDHFNEYGVVFKGEQAQTDCDIVILATGYRRSYPFLEETVFKPNNFDINENRLDIYENQFLPHLEHSKTLCFIGLAYLQGSVLPLAELQSRWFALLMANKIKSLPNQKQMWIEIEENKKWIEKNFPEYKTKLADRFWIPTMDKLAEKIGAKPNLLKYFFTDINLWWNLYTGPCVPYQYRLEGPNKWSGAREAILMTNKRLIKPMTTTVGKNHIDKL